MKKFVITVDTCWCGIDKEYPAIADSEVDLWDVAEELQSSNEFTGTRDDWEILVNDAGQIIYGDV